MSRQTFAATDIADFPPASHGAVVNTTARTNLWVPALWTPIAALDPKPGKAYLLRAGGSISTTGTPTILFVPTFGQSATPASNVSLGSSGAFTLGSGLSGVPWYAEFLLGFRQIGVAASGASCIGHGTVTVSGGSGNVSQAVAMGGTSVTTADNTTAQGLTLDVTWGTASASNTITCIWTLLQSLN